MAVHRDGVLGERQRFAAGDPDLLGDEVERGDQLGDAMLDLEPRVHLEEVELAVVGTLDRLVEHLDRARVDVATRLRDLHRGLAHRSADLLAQARGRRLLDQLLVSALHRAVALAEPHRVAVDVGEDLHLDVTRSGEVLLEVRLGPPEVRLGLALRRVQRRLRVAGILHDLHAAAATAVRGLDRDRPPDLLTERDDVVGVLDRIQRARHALDATAVRGTPGGDLVAHHVDRVGRGTDPRHAALADDPGKVRVLGVEAVAGVDTVGARPLDDTQDRVGVEVALGRALASEGVGLVGVPDVERISVQLRVDRDRGDPQLAARPHDADGDLAAVGDQDLLQHVHLSQW